VDTWKIQEVLEEAERNIDAEVSQPLEILRGKRKGEVSKRKPTRISISGRIEG